MRVHLIIGGLVLLIVIMYLYRYLLRDNYLNIEQTTNLETDGYIILKNILTKNELEFVSKLWDSGKYKEINDYIIPKFRLDKIFKPDYVLMDYIMFIENSVLHTCHRDNNAYQFNDIKNRSYTMLLYIDDMNKCLDILPKSHNTYNDFYTIDRTKTFSCKPGDLIIFDSGLVHAGSVDSNDNNRRIQFKVTHKDDVKLLSYFDKYHKLVSKKNTNSYLSKLVQKHFTCQYPILADVTQGKIKSI